MKPNRSEAPDERKFVERHAKAILIGLSLLLVATVALAVHLATRPSTELTPLTDTIGHIDAGDVTSAVINENSRQIAITLDDEATNEVDDSALDDDGHAVLTSVYTGLWSDTLTDSLLDADVEVDVIAPKGSNVLLSMLVSMLPLFILVALVVVMMRSQLFKPKRFEQAEIPSTRFADVAGVDEAVSEMRELVQFLREGDKFEAMGARTPRGALFVGPPGTGKTLLARAVAGEAGVPFFQVNGSDFVEMFAGLGASRVRSLFKKVKIAGKAIIFIDEIDSVGRKRGGGSAGSGGVAEMENTLTALLTEMDGFESTEVIVIGATNRLDVLDEALRRRLEHIIQVPLPDRRGRSLILQVHAKGKPFADATDWDAVGSQAYGMSGAELERVINEACMDAVRKGDALVSTVHLLGALSTIQVGRERVSAALTERDKEITAWHEAGHAAVCILSEHLADPTFVTIVPRGESGGHTRPGGSDDAFRTNAQLRAELDMALGGRVAEEMLLGSGIHTQGAHGDLAHATALATQMVTQFGMGDRLVQTPEDALRLGAEQSQRVSNEVDIMLVSAKARARNMLHKNEALVRALAERLIEVETLSGNDVTLAVAQVASPIQRVGDKGKALLPDTAHGLSIGGADTLPAKEED